MKAMTAAASSADAVLRPGLLPGVAPQSDAERVPRPPIPPEVSDLEPSVYRFILKHSLKRQIFLLLLTLASFPFLYYSLDLPKTIVNRAIAGKHFPEPFLGFEFDQVPYLMILSALFIALVFINGAFKYFINTYKGQIGERMLRRFRYSLYQRLLCFPLSYFHKNSSAQIIPMITVECEQLGGFIGDAFNLPLFQGGQLLTMILFMFMQDPILAAAAIALYPVQGYIIPKLQFKVNQLAKQRVRTVRQVADRVQESAAGIVEIQANDTVKLNLTDFAHVLGRIYDIRFEIYKRKFFAKFLNNFIGQLTPFFFYSLGGYLVIKGDLSFGALVAITVAQKDLASPWKELLDFYQIKENSRITYEQIVEQFQPSGMTDAKLLLAEPEQVMPLTGELSVANVSLAEDDRSRVVDAVSFTVRLDEHVAVIGQSGSGKSELALLLARLVGASSGRITIGGADLAELPVAVIGRRIGYVGAMPYLFAGTLRDNLLLGLRHIPLRPPEYDDAAERRRARRLYEARRSGNIDFDIHADWIDYRSAGVNDRAELMTEMFAGLPPEHEFFEQFSFIGAQELPEFATILAAAESGGLGALDNQQRDRLLSLPFKLIAARHRLGVLDERMQQRLLEARRAFREGLAEEARGQIEFFDPARYNAAASLQDNILFGKIAYGEAEATMRVPQLLREVLDALSLRSAVMDVGLGYHVGTAGSRLSLAQRQRAAIARALL